MMLEDSISVTLEEKQVSRPTQLAARNNNYFDSTTQDNKNGKMARDQQASLRTSSCKNSQSLLAKDKKVRLSLKDNSVNFCEDGEEMVEEIELIEGVVEPDKFTLNKIN